MSSISSYSTQAVVRGAILLADNMRNGVDTSDTLAGILNELRRRLPVPDQIVVGRAYFYVGDPSKELNTAAWVKTNPRIAVCRLQDFVGRPTMRYIIPPPKGSIASFADPKLYRDVTDYLLKEQNDDATSIEQKHSGVYRPKNTAAPEMLPIQGVEIQRITLDEACMFVRRIQPVSVGGVCLQRVADIRKGIIESL